MISRVEWLKYYEQFNNCSEADTDFCNSFLGCEGCPFNIDYEMDDLLEAAAEIFNEQLMTNGRLEDDGK